MIDAELAEAMHAKNAAFARLAAKTRDVLAWQQAHHTPEGYDELPGALAQTRARLEDEYRRAQRRYRFALGRR